MSRFILHIGSTVSIMLFGVVLLLLANQHPDGAIWPRSSYYYICASHFEVGVGSPFGRGMWGVPAWGALLTFGALPAWSLIRLVTRHLSRRGAPAAVANQSDEYGDVV